MKKFWIVTAMSAAMMVCAQANAGGSTDPSGGPKTVKAFASSPIMDGVNGGYYSILWALFGL